MSKERAVGIDLGTTYSAMAWIDETGQSQLLPNAEGDLLTPSVVLFDDEAVIVGKQAKKLGLHDATRLADCVKRDMGAPLYSRTLGGIQLPPEVIQAYILRKLKIDSEKVIGSNPKVVITVPAFFDEPRRKSTVDAAHVAGLHLLDIINEPTAAALAFGEVLGYLRDSSTANPKSEFILVYDLGGGTFDATLIEMKAGDLRTIATDGDVQLGGRDWDDVLANLAAEEFKRQFGSDPRLERLALQRLIVQAEEAKHTLSVRSSAIIKVVFAGHALEYRVTRERFDEETAHLLERTAYVTRQLLTAAGLAWSELSRILLVGGSTRMPMVAQMLLDRTGIKPDHTVNPDEAVARGAAIYADYLMAGQVESGRRPKFHITNVNSHSLGIEGVDPTSGRKGNNIIIKRNTPLPAKRTKRFETKRPDQRSVVVKVLEGESTSPDECTPIGKTVIRDLPGGLPAGWPVSVTYEYLTNGRLKVSAEVQGTNRPVHLELERDGSLSNTLVSQWSRVVAAGAGLNACAMMTRGETPILPSGSKGGFPQSQATPAPSSLHTPAPYMPGAPAPISSSGSSNMPRPSAYPVGGMSGTGAVIPTATPVAAGLPQGNMLPSPVMQNPGMQNPGMQNAGMLQPMGVTMPAPVAYPQGATNGNAQPDPLGSGSRGSGQFAQPAPGLLQPPGSAPSMTAPKPASGSSLMFWGLVGGLVLLLFGSSLAALYLLGY